LAAIEGKIKRLRSVLFFWESPDRSQPARLLTEDGRIEDINLEVLKGCGESPIQDIYQAWQLDASNLVHDPALGFDIQVITERDWAPIELWQANPAKWSFEQVCKIANIQDDLARAISTRKNSKDMGMYVMLVIAVMIAIGTLFLLATKNVDWTSIPLIGGFFKGG
jgi:hypothetical protein